MKDCLCRALPHNPSGGAPVGVPRRNEVSHPLPPPARVRRTLSGQHENAGAGLCERHLDNTGTLGRLSIPAGVLPSGWLY